MTEPRSLPYGSWPSPVTIDLAVASSLTLREPRLNGNDVYWIEGRPREGGRQVVVHWTAEAGARDVTPPGMNTRTMSHEYGGGAYAVRDGTVYLSNMADGRLYRQSVGEEAAVPITPEGPYRFADAIVDKPRHRLVAVREDHSPMVAAGAATDEPRGPEPENTLVSIGLADDDAGRVTVLAAGYDFYSTPRLSPDGNRLAWLSWRHPNMPWDESELWLAEIDEHGALREARRVAGSPDESIAQPEWAPDGSLVYVSDRSGWWNLYRLPVGAASDIEPVALAPMEADFAGPQWVFGMSWYGIAGDGTIAAIARRSGADELWMIPLAGPPERIAVPDSEMHTLRVSGQRLLYVGASPVDPAQVVLLDLVDGERRVLRRSFELAFDAAYVARPEAISFPTTGGQEAHALYYPPTNPDFRGPAGERPPLIVISHGGPTSDASGALSLETQVFTSRGMAVVDVDYRGSSGYGRAYMRQLDGQWGIVDVDDCISAARYLAERGDVDGRRMAIRGGSAGGFTTLCALAFHDVFQAGASYFGVADLEALARFTHKFESRYLDRLVAPYPAGRATYIERSPIHSSDRISSPVIVLQGRDDKVVPVDQAEQLVGALRARGVPHAYLCFDGEGHGFRQADNIRRSIEAELSFYAQVFGFALADPVEPIALS